MKLNCPACGAEVQFKSRSSIMAVCPYCGSTLVRHDLNLENLGKMAELKPDSSPLQIGSEGIYLGGRFEIIGKQKMSWKNGNWNEWYLYFDNGNDGWLAEAQGLYMVSSQVLEPIPFPKVSQLKVEQSIPLKGNDYSVDDIKEIVCAGSEGELPARMVQGRKSVSIDLTGPGKKFASIDFSPEGDRLFLGKYVEFDDLKFKNLKEKSEIEETQSRTVDAPARKAGAVKAFSCPSCGASVTIRAAGRSITAVCESCSSVIDLTDENYKVLSKAAEKMSHKMLIHLGAKGKLHGDIWEIVGYVERSDGSGYYSWVEYLLFEQKKGFRWLTEFDGHWNFLSSTKEKPVRESGYRQIARFLGKKYFLFHSGRAVITYITGEFYWRASIGENVKVEDYVSPPEILSCETSPDEVVWSIGTYLNAEDVKNSFALSGPLPVQKGVAPNQPSTIISQGIGKYWGVFIGLLVLLQIIFLGSAKDETAFTGQFTYNGPKVEATRQFNLKHGTTNVAVVINAPGLVNNWLEIQGELVNDENGRSLEFEQGMEFYSGSDSDGPWTEGSQVSEKLLSSIPQGKYHLNLEPSSDNNKSKFDYTVSVKRDVPAWANFIWAFLLITIFPLITWWRSRSFEVSRWSQSDFSPYYSQQEED